MEFVPYKLLNATECGVLHRPTIARISGERRTGAAAALTVT